MILHRHLNPSWLRLFFSAITLLVLSQFSCAAENNLSISAKDLQPHLNYLASPDRRGRDDWGKIESRDYIINHFKSIGLKPLFPDGFIQVVPEFGDASNSPGVAGQNVGGFVAGTDPKLKHEWIIVNAHYDHLGVRKGKVYPGADDNASGVAMLLEVARHFAKTPAKRSVAFVSFDLEEHLLWGSRWFLAHAPMEIDSIKFCLTADMIGRSLGGLDLPTVFVLGSERSPQVKSALARVAVPDGLEIARLGIDIIGVRSDYGPFYYRGIPFLFFSTGEHPDYHTSRDTLERLNVKKTARISTVMLRIARDISNQPEEITWIGKPVPDLEEVKSVHHLTGQLLAAEEEDQLKLTDLQRFFVSQVHSKTKFMLKRNRISKAERKWLVRSTKILMLSIF